MNYYIQMTLPEITNDTIIEYQIDISGGNRYDAIVELTNRPNHHGKYGFINNNNDLFGNGYKFVSKKQALDIIIDNLKSAINRSEYPLPVLKINGNKVVVFKKIEM